MLNKGSSPVALPIRLEARKRTFTEANDGPQVLFSTAGNVHMSHELLFGYNQLLFAFGTTKLDTKRFRAD